MMGEKVGAIVVPVPGGAFDPALLIRHARSVLADFKVPQYLCVRTDLLPRNPGGKILKSVLRKDTDWGRRCADPLPRSARLPLGALP